MDTTSWNNRFMGGCFSDDSWESSYPKNGGTTLWALFSA